MIKKREDIQQYNRPDQKDLRRQLRNEGEDLKQLCGLY